MGEIDLRDLQQRCWQTAEDQGHHEVLCHLAPRLQTLIRLALVHTEVSEAWEMVAVFPVSMAALPDGVRSALSEECADIAMRLLEMCWDVAIVLESMPDTIPEPMDTSDLVAHLGRLHALIDRITQSVKRHGITPAMGTLTHNALVSLWTLARSLGIDMEHAIKAKDAHNRARPYHYGTPEESI